MWWKFRGSNNSIKSKKTNIRHRVAEFGTYTCCNKTIICKLDLHRKKG